MYYTFHPTSASIVPVKWSLQHCRHICARPIGWVSISLSVSTTTSERVVRDTLVPALLGSLAESRSAAMRTDSEAVTGEPAEMLREAETLLCAVAEANQRAANLLKKAGGGVESDLKANIRTLKHRVSKPAAHQEGRRTAGRSTPRRTVGESGALSCGGVELTCQNDEDTSSDDSS